MQTVESQTFKCKFHAKMRFIFVFLFAVFSWQVDVPVVFADKVMKAGMKHIEIIAKAYEKGK